MAEIRFYKSAFDDKFETYSFDMNKTLQENVDSLCNSSFTEMVECYDSATGETFYAPIEENTEDGHTVVIVNGRSVSADYKVQETDLVNVMYIPLSGENTTEAWWGAIGGGAIAGALVWGIVGLIAGGGWGLLAGVIVGGIWGGFVGWNIQNSLVGPENKVKDEDKKGIQHPDVRGAENQPLANNVYPFVIGKHLIAPYVVADPYTEYSGDKGENAYVRTVFCAGYGPLKLTDFKLGDFFLAYNRSQGVERRTVINGVLKGYSTEEADDGDILDRWKNNDIEIEIIQQSSKCATQVNEYFQSKTNINLSNRPLIPGTQMIAAGWTDVDPDGISSVYSSTYSNRTETKCVVVTPIVSENVILSPEQLKSDANKLLNNQTIPYEILLAEFSGEGCISEAEVYAEQLHRHLAEVELHEKEINFGNIYPHKIVDQEINANLFYIKDELLQQAATVTYKGVSFPKDFRTNGVWFTESCPMAFTINLNAPSGLYSARSATRKSNNKITSSTDYAQIPLWFAVQWRFYNEGNSSSASDGSDYSSWHNVTTWNGTENSTLLQTYNHQAMVDDKNAHVGNVFDFETKVNLDKSPIEIDEYVGKLSFFSAPYSDVTVRSVVIGQRFRPCIGTTQVAPVCGPTDFYIGNYLNPNKDNVLFDKKTHTLYIDAYNKIEDVGDGVTALIGEDRDVFDTIALDDEPFEISDARGFNQFRGTGTDTTVTVKYLKIAKNFFLAEKETVSTISDFWANKKLVNFQTLSGTNGKDQLRIRGTVEFSKEDCKKMLNPSNRIKGVEVRVVRVSPNYLNQEQKDEESDYPKYGTYSYSDVINVESIVTKCFDENKLRNEDVLEAVPIQSEADMKKFCYIAIKAKADTGGNIVNQLSQLNCMAESFSPVWDSAEKKWLPENVHKKINYYGYFAEGGISDGEAFPDSTKVYFVKDDEEYVYAATVPNFGTQMYIGTDRLKTSTESEISKELYEFGRGKGFDWYKEDCGSNYGDLIRAEVFSEEPAIKNGYECSYLPDSAKIFNDATSASGFMLGCVGPQNGKYADGYENINVTSVGEWWEDCQSVRDGSTYNVDDTVHKAGDKVEVKFEANGYVTQSQKKETLLKDLAITGRAVFTYDETGRIKVIMDKPADYVDGVINANNCIEETNTFSFAESPAGLRIAYDDENDGYTQNSLYCWADGNDLSSYRGIVRGYQFKYITNPYQAHSLGRYFLACECLKKHVLTEKVGREGRLFPLGSVVLVQSDELLLGDGSARIQEVIEDNGTIYGFTTDKAIEYKEETETFDGQLRSVKGVEIFQPKQYGKSRVVNLRLALTGTKVLNDEYEMKEGTTNLFLFAEPVIRYTGEDRSDNSGRYIFKTGDIVMFGTVEKISVKYRVIKVKPDEKGTFTQTLNLYDETLYNYGAKLPVFQNKMTVPPAPEQMLPLNETVSTVRESLEENARIMNDTRVTTSAKFVEITAPDGLVFKNNVPASLTLTVQAQGFTPTTYAWYKDGTVISGETSATYEATRAGVYKVLVDGEYEDYVTVISVEDGESESVYNCELTPKTDTADSRLRGELNLAVYKDGTQTTENLFVRYRYEYYTFTNHKAVLNWSQWDSVTATSGTAVLTANTSPKRNWQVQVYRNGSQFTPYSDLLCTGQYSNGVSKSIWLDTGYSSVNVSEEGVFSPLKITLTGKIKVENELSDYSGRFKVYYTTDSSLGTWTLGYSSSADETSCEWTIASGTEKIKCQLYEGGGFTNLLEEDFITVNHNGKSVYNCSVSNENFSIPTDSGLVPTGNIPISVTFDAYKGSTQLDPVAPSTTLTSGKFKVSTPSNQGGLTITQATAGTLTFTPSTSTAILRNKNISVTVTYDDGSTVTKTISISAAVQGANGQDGADGGYQDYQFAVGDFGLTDEQARALDWYDAPPTVPDGKCLYMATKFIQGV